MAVFTKDNARIMAARGLQTRRLNRERQKTIEAAIPLIRSPEAAAEALADQGDILARITRLLLRASAPGRVCDLARAYQMVFLCWCRLAEIPEPRALAGQTRLVRRNGQAVAFAAIPMPGIPEPPSAEPRQAEATPHEGTQGIS